MLAGAVQGVIGFYDHNIDLQALGKYTESVVQLSRVPGEVELVPRSTPRFVPLPISRAGSSALPVLAHRPIS